MQWIAAPSTGHPTSKPGCSMRDCRHLLVACGPLVYRLSVSDTRVPASCIPRSVFKLVGGTHDVHAVVGGMGGPDASRQRQAAAMLLQYFLPASLDKKHCCTHSWHTLSLF